MLHYLIPARNQAEKSRPRSFAQRAIEAFLERIATITGMRLVQDARTIPQAQEDLEDLFRLISSLQKNGIVKEFGRSIPMPDEPRYQGWFVTHARDEIAGGMSLLSDRAALTAATAECVERYLWQHDGSALLPTRATTISIRGARIEPSRFAGYSPETRARDPELRITDESIFAWIQGYSWTGRCRIMIPAQTMSAYAARKKNREEEPLIREPISTGLATGPTRENAVLSGALEIIERDAFMIMWLNQLSFPRIPIETLLSDSETLRELIARCARYRLTVDIVRLITDAPTYAICAVISDPAHMPRFTIGLSAHHDLSRAAEKAILEALRARVNIRRRTKNCAEPFRGEGREIHHLERGDYWADPSRAELLSFLIRAPVVPSVPEPWDTDTDKEHLARIIIWCREKGYELVSVDLGRSKKNLTPWHIHSVAIPELQPMHQHEARPALHGARLREIPERFDYSPRERPFTEEPHPFV